MVAAFTVALLAGAQTAMANSVVAGDIIKFGDRNGSPGGEFLANVNPGTAGAWAFVTFCLQKTEYIDFTSNFVVDAVTDYATSDPAGPLPGGRGGDASGHDPLDARTAWLFTQFTNGSLAGYDGSATSANRLQNAIWMIEQEIAIDATNAYYNLANASGWTNIGDVRVLNLKRWVAASNGTPGYWVESQDQLTRSVPEPSSLLLFGFSLAAITAARVRSRKTSQA